MRVCRTHRLVCSECKHTSPRRETMATYTHIAVERSHADRIATITMRRPEVHNAFNAQLVQDVQAAFTELRSDTRLHAVILTGEGPSFSAGADLNMMRSEEGRVGKECRSRWSPYH